jgi:hypothetical protein
MTNSVVLPTFANADVCGRRARKRRASTASAVKCARVPADFRPILRALPERGPSGRWPSGLEPSFFRTLSLRECLSRRHGRRGRRTVRPERAGGSVAPAQPDSERVGAHDRGSAA